MRRRLSPVGRVLGPAVLVLGLAVVVTQHARGLSSASEPDSVRPAAAPDHTHTATGDAVAEYERGVAGAYAGALAQAQAEAYWLAVAAANQAATAASEGSGSGTRRSGCADPLACIRECESQGDYGAVSSGGTYRGAYQFDQASWESVGGTGDPAAAPPEEQDARAAALYGSSGSSPWPNCG
jgi:Transglycosylase-like domain